MSKTWLRADGEVRTVRPTRAALNLLLKVRTALQGDDAFITQMSIDEQEVGQVEAHCVLGWMAVLSGFDGETYPNEVIGPKHGRTLRHRYPTAAALYAETVDGPGIIEDGIGSKVTQVVNESEVYSHNDDTGLEGVLNALDDTIRYAEHVLGKGK